jgi:D-sedoheptulose 7-phosphate isomerase
VSNLEIYFRQQADVVINLPTGKIREFASLLNATASSGKTIWVCGNGGSATTAAHMATDFSKGLFQNTGRQFRTICVNEQLGPMSAWSNDISYETALLNYMKSVCSDGDLIVLISGSGNSKNILIATEIIKDFKVSLVGMTGKGGGHLGELLDINIEVGSNDMQIIENGHLIITHSVLDLISGKIN